MAAHHAAAGKQSACYLSVMPRNKAPVTLCSRATLIFSAYFSPRHSPICLIFCPPFNRRGGAPARRFAFPTGQEEANTLHQSPTERAGERVRSEQVHHQRQEEEDLHRHQPVGAADHDLVPEQEGEGEEVRGQSEEQRAVAPTVTVTGITWCMCVLLMKTKL